MTPAELVVLFDIDGTLLRCHGAGRVAIQAAFAEVTGDADALAAVEFEGMTDRAIVRAGLAAGAWAVAGADEEATIDEILGRYLAHLPAALVPRRPEVLEGAEALVATLTARPRTAVGLGTGNLAAGARHKLAAVGLWHRFAFGGFGSDREERGQLLEVGAGRGAAALGIARDQTAVVVIGDTPKDIHAAHAIGARCLAVATSRYSVAVLHAEGADIAVPTLTAAAVRSFFD